MVRTKGTAPKVHTHAWKPSVLPKLQVVEDHSLSRSKVFIEIKVEARTRGAKKQKQKRNFFERLIGGLPVEVVVQASTNLVRQYHIVWS
jgi:hypothetical protein